MEGWFLSDGNDFREGVSQVEAEEICRNNLETVMGYCWRESDPNSCWVKYKGCSLG
jgi:hypothetical protein